MRRKRGKGFLKLGLQLEVMGGGGVKTGKLGGRAGAKGKRGEGRRRGQKTREGC